MTTDFVLVVEDDADIRDALVELIEEHGCRAIGAENGRIALDRLENARTDRTCLILLDLMMPVMDGPTFRREQMKREALASIPVVLITASREQSVLQAMAAAGFLTKPVELDDVLRMVKRYCTCPALA